MPSPNQRNESVNSSDVRSLARLITQIERQDPARIAELKARHAQTGSAHVIGITGPPGSGKSTLTDKIIVELRKRRRRVAVVAIDPSSPFTGGAILGDRIRMMQHATDDGVFIRSLASRGHLGGLSRATAETVRALDAAGYDDIIIETVGVGQSEVDIVRSADTVVLVAVPGLGDDIQAIKAGVMEIGDIFCVNKADRDGAERVVRETRSMLETAVLNGANTRFSALYQALARLENPVAEAESVRLAFNGKVTGTHHVAKLADDPHHGMQLRLPPVLLTIAEQGSGISALVDEIRLHHEILERTGFLEQHRCENTLWELRNTIADLLLDRLRDESLDSHFRRMATEIIQKKRDYYQALDEVYACVLGSLTPTTSERNTDDRKD